MNTSRTIFKLSTSAALLAASTAQAAPGTLTEYPLFLGNSVLPNIFFLVDDSGSMRLEFLTKDFENSGRLSAQSEADYPTPAFIHRVVDGETCTFESSSGGDDGFQFILETARNDDCDVAAEEEWRARDYSVNHLYYNPNQRYEPWSGVDEDGVEYQNMSATSARIDPYDPGDGTINLLTESAVFTTGDERDYYRSDEWREWCEDTDVRGRCRGWRYYEAGALVWVHNLPESSADGSVINTQQNFANWFTYHRSREYAAKYALSSVINDEEVYARFGYGTINDVTTTDAPTTVLVGDSTASQRQEILETLFESRPGGSTPLRRALLAVGEYFDTDNALFDEGIAAEESPILNEDQGGACQRNSTILMTDGIFSNSGAEWNDRFDIIGNEDNGGNTSSDYDEGHYGDGFTRTLADIAMHYFERDLDTSLEDSVTLSDIENESLGNPTTDVRLHQHMNTYTIAFGISGTLDPTLDPSSGTFPGWPNPAADDLAKVDDLWHAAYNSRASFLSANSPQDLVAALQDALGELVEKAGSPSQIEFTDYFLDEDSLFFSSSFTSSLWTGELKAFDIDLSDLTFEQSWEAGEELSGRSHGGRTIISYNGEDGIPFRWNTSLLSGTQQVALGNEAVLNYLRGDNSNEEDELDGVYRDRDGDLLGDIVNSAPVYIGNPKFIFPSRDPFGETGDRYFDFKSPYYADASSARTPVVYVGANDGMLHGFHAETGEELLAYVPEAVYENLADLSDPEYGHHYFVDGTPTQFDAYFGPRGGVKDWRTVLTGGLNRGGKAWYALDVTDPDSFSERNAGNIVLWEFGEGDDVVDTEESDVGYSFSQPLVAITETEDFSGDKRWAVITGNGYNSDSGIAKLFIIFLDANPEGGWEAGDDYIEISTGVGTADDKNGLSSPIVVDSDGDWVADRVYAGDVQGNLWSFDISSDNTSDWDIANGGNPLFQARNAAGEIQPITARPTVARHPNFVLSNDNSPNVIVYFGTGQYVTVDAPSIKETQSFYAVWDHGDTDGYTRADLTEQEITEYLATTRGSDSEAAQEVEARITDDDTIVHYNDEAGGNKGWYIDLDSDSAFGAASGERITTSAQVRDRVVYVDTFIPTPDTCTPGVDVWFMTLDYLNGATPYRQVIDLTNNNVVDQADYVTMPGSEPSDGNYTSTSGTKFEGGTSGGMSSVTDSVVGFKGGDNDQLTAKSGGPTLTNGRLSWQELRPQ